MSIKSELKEKKYRDPVIHEQDLYDYSCGCNVGVLVTKTVMKKLTKLQAEHLTKVKKLLLDEADEGNVFSSMWTLAYPEGEQTTVNFIDNDDIKKRIGWATSSNQPVKRDLVFVAKGMQEAEEMANQYFKELEKE